MGDENGFQVGMGIGMDIWLENGNGYGYEFLKSEPDYVPNLLVRCNKNMPKPKAKC